MSKLGQIVESIEKYNKFVLDQVKRARTDEQFGRELLGRWNDTKAKIPVTRTPTGVPLPRLALPEMDEPGEIARYLFGEGLPGEFPFLNGAYREMYLEPIREVESFEKNGGPPQRSARPPLPQAEEPTRLFSGLMLAEDTNERFHYLTRHQRTHRLSTAFDGPTLYGIDSDADGVFGKIGEGGVAIDTVEDMVRLYDGFDLGSPNFSASMTISGPAPIIMAMYIAAAKRRFGPKVVPKLRGTIQADIFKEVQAQNETIFPIEASLRFLTDMVEFTTREMPRWYPISISGYHIGEAGSTPVQQAAYTLSNGFAYAEMFAARGIPVDQFGPRLSFFLDCGLDAEYIALARVSRRIWAIGMRDVFGAGPTGAAFQIAHPDQRSLANRSGIQKQSYPHRGRIGSRLHERDQFVPLKQRGRTVHDAERRMDSACRARAGDPARGVRHFQAHHEHVERFARDESGRALCGSGDSR